MDEKQVESESGRGRGGRPAGWGVRHTFVFLGFLGFANVYAMRVNLSVAIIYMVNNTAIPHDNVSSAGSCPGAPLNATKHSKDGPFVWPEAQQGIILGMFFYGYVLTQLPGGRLAEMFGGKWLFGVGVLVTAVFTLLTPLAATSNRLYLLYAVRVVEGLGEGVTFPAMLAMLARWSAPTERSRFTSNAYAGSAFGTVISMPLSVYLCEAVSWQSVFYVFGALGILWFLAWSWLVYDGPEEHPSISQQEKDFLQAALTECEAERPSAIPWRAIATSPAVWAIAATHVTQGFGEST